jgi:hypothetical protein
MLDNQEQLLPDATENQSAETNNVEANENPINTELETITEVANEVETSETLSESVTTEIADEVETEVVELTTTSDEVEEEQKNEVVSLVEETESNLEVQEVTDNDDSNENEGESTKNAIEVIEEAVATESVSEEMIPELPMVNYDDSMDCKSIVATLKSLIAIHPVQTIGKHVEELKRLFNIKFGALLKEAKTKFLEENADPSDFHYENPIQKEYNEVLLEYKKLRQQYYNNIEKNQHTNLALKIAIIDELKDLIENGNPDTMYKKFREIQSKWRSVGPVPRDSYSDTWRTYHFHVERFYDLLHLSNELREMDFKHNYEEKMKLVERVEVLAESKDVKAAFEDLVKQPIKSMTDVKNILKL